MNKFYSTKVVIDIESGAVLERDRVEYSGPWALCGFDTSVAGAILKEVYEGPLREQIDSKV